MKRMIFFFKSTSKLRRKNSELKNTVTYTRNFVLFMHKEFPAISKQKIIIHTTILPFFFLSIEFVLMTIIFKKLSKSIDETVYGTKIKIYFSVSSKRIKNQDKMIFLKYFSHLEFFVQKQVRS